MTLPMREDGSRPGGTGPKGLRQLLGSVPRDYWPKLSDRPAYDLSRLVAQQALGRRTPRGHQSSGVDHKRSETAREVRGADGGCPMQSAHLTALVVRENAYRMTTRRRRVRRLYTSFGAFPSVLSGATQTANPSGVGGVPMGEASQRALHIALSPQLSDAAQPR